MPKILVGDIFAVIATLVALSIPLTIIGLLIYIAKLIKNLEKSDLKSVCIWGHTYIKAYLLV